MISVLISPVWVDFVSHFGSVPGIAALSRAYQYRAVKAIRQNSLDPAETVPGQFGICRQKRLCYRKIFKEETK